MRASTPSNVREELGALLKLALPLAVAQVGLTFMGLVDAAVVGQWDTAALAAVNLGDSYMMTILLFGMGVMMGLDPVAAQRLGAGDPRGARRALGDAGRVALLIMPLLYGLIWALDRFVLGPVAQGLPPAEWMRADPAVGRDARDYVLARAAGVLPWALFAALRSWFYAKHLTRPMLVVIVLGNVANLALNYVLVFGDAGLVRLGLPECGIPAWGVVGAGVATTIVTILLMLALIPPAVRARREEEAFLPPVDPEAPPPESRWRGMSRILRIGLPVAAQTTLEVAIFNVVAVMTSPYGATTQAAHAIAIRVASVSFMATTGIGAAASVRVGLAIGSGRTAAARRSGFTAIGLGIAWMTGCGLVLMLFPDAISRIFTSDPEVVDAARPLLRIAAVFQIFDGTQSVASGALRGAGDTSIPFLANLAAYWAIGLPVCLYLKERLGVPGLWWGLSAGLFVVSILLTWRFARLTRVDVDRVG